MASGTNGLIVVAHELRKVAQHALENVLGFILPLFLLSLIGGGIRQVADQLDRRASPVVALAFVGVSALVWMAVLAMVTPSAVRGTDGRIRGGFVVGFAAAAAMVWVYIFAVFSYLLHKLGAVPVVITAHPDAPLSDLLDAYLWYFLDLIPVLHVNEALGWSADVVLTGGWAGVVLLLFRVVIVFQVFALARRLLQARKEGRADTTHV
jgi:hypothetical protein